MDSTQAKELSWSFNPWRRDWRRPVAALALEIALAALGGYSFTAPNWWPDMLAWGLMALLFLIGMTFPIFVPIYYRLDEKGVLVRFLAAPSFRAWEHYRNFYPHKRTVHLTTLPKPSALDPFRGHSLQYDGNKAEVDAFIEAHMTLKGQPEAK